MSLRPAPGLRGRVPGRAGDAAQATGGGPARPAEARNGSGPTLEV